MTELAEFKKQNAKEHKEFMDLLAPLVEERKYRDWLEASTAKWIKRIAILVGLIVSVLTLIKAYPYFAPK